MSNASRDPVPLSAALSQFRQKAEEMKRKLDSDPVLREQIAKRIAEQEAEKEAERKRWVQSCREADFAGSGIPRRLFSLVVQPDDTEAMRVTKAWHASGKTFLVLSGGVGVGKTVAAAYAVSLVPPRIPVPGCEEQFPSFFRSAPPGLFCKAREIATLSQFDADGWDRFHGAPLLAIDDLGAEALDEKGWALSAILGLLDRRYDDEARTVITTNLGVDGVRARYGKDGGRLFDRLKETADWAELGGASLRRSA
jgi:DNA replication protein DnaC